MTINLLAMSVISKLSSGDTLLVHGTSPLLAAIFTRRAAEHGINAMDTTTESNALVSQAIFIHPCAPKRTIQAMMPVNVKAFVHLSSHASAKRVASQIAALLPSHCIQESISTLFGEDAYLYSPSAESVQGILRTAWLKSQEDLVEVDEAIDADMVSLRDIRNDNIGKGPTSIVNWTADTTVPVKVKPIDFRPLFVNDKTHWLIGLTRELGLSLCEWMIRHGARYVVLISQDPKVDESWVGKKKAIGAIISVLAKFDIPSSVIPLFHR